MSDRIAVVVPAYNEPSIEQTLEGLYQQSMRNDDVHHFIVDNASTDNTGSHIHEFMRRREDFPMTLIEEDQKGTGAASDTGFKTAIEAGYTIIARTDADSIPLPDWTTKIAENLTDSSTQLLGGRSIPIHDEHYRFGDGLLLPVAIKAARIALGIEHLDRRYLKVVIGHNMATRAEAYTVVGGFERTAIDDADEDIDFSLKIIDAFGMDAVKFDSSLEVATSMRRIRNYGIGKTSLHHLFPGRRGNSGRVIDIR